MREITPLMAPPAVAKMEASTPDVDHERSRLPRRHWVATALAAPLVLGAWMLLSGHLIALPCVGNATAAKSPQQQQDQPQCVQVAPLLPNATSPGLAAMDAYMSTPAFRELSATRLSGAVRVRTESYDDMGPVGEDPRWDRMRPFAAYLAQNFALAHAVLALEHVNEHGLLYTWQGSDASLKPVVLMAHQDTVPVANETVGQWTHPPFSGFFDGSFVWGRGASDCKDSLVGILSAVEVLAAAEFLQSSPHYRSQTVLSWLQPWAARYAFLVCIVMFVFLSTTMWKTGVNATKFMAAYLPHIVFFLIVAGRKLVNFRDPQARGWVWLQTGAGGAELIRKLRDLDNLSERAADRRLDDESGPNPNPPPPPTSPQQQYAATRSYSWRPDGYQNGVDDDDEIQEAGAVQMVHVQPKDTTQTQRAGEAQGWD